MAGLQPVDDIAATHNVLQHEYDIKKEHPELEDPSLGSYEEDDDDDEGVHAGLVFPTEEERITLRRVSDKLPYAAYRECLDFFPPTARSLKASSSGRRRRAGWTFLCMLATS